MSTNAHTLSMSHPPPQSRGVVPEGAGDATAPPDIGRPSYGPAEYTFVLMVPYINIVFSIYVFSILL